MQYSYPENSQSLIVTYNRTREGPNWIMVYYKNVAAPCFTVKDVRSRFGSAKYTDSCKKACEWVQACIDKYEAVVEEEEGRADTSFASEALNESDPNYQTRMVT